jgi:hypothetical protein
MSAMQIIKFANNLSALRLSANDSWRFDKLKFVGLFITRCTSRRAMTTADKTRLICFDRFDVKNLSIFDKFRM